MKAAILARVSTSKQAEAGHHSIPYQLDAMVAFAAKRGWNVVATYEIPGESAFKWNVLERPQFEAVLAAAARREFDVLLVYDVSRLARNQAVLHETRRQLHEMGMQLWSVSGDYDVVADPMRAGVEGMVAEQSSLDHSRRVKAAYARRHATGMHTGDVPFGYDLRSLEIVPAEAEAIRWGFAAYARGLGFLAISSEWNRRGLLPRSKRGLVAFTVSSVQSVIESRFYLGLVSHLGNERPGNHAAIVTADQWEAAQRRTRKHGPHENRYGSLLQGIAECWHCVGPVWTKSLGEKRHVYYWEPSKVRARECAAQGKLWRADEADEIAAAAIQAMRLDGHWLDWARSMATHEQRPQLFAVREQLEGRKRRVTEAYEAGVRSRDSWLSELRRLDAELRAIPVAVAPTVLRVGARLTDMADAWRYWTPQQRNDAARTILESALLDIPGRDVAWKPAPEFKPYFDARHAFMSETKSGGTPDRTRTPVLPSGFFTPWEWVA